MSLDTWLQPLIDPEVEAHVRSLVNALGGSGTDDSGQYILGDDALACLRDLKRWLKLYDNKTDRLDVARCLAEANLVKGDLLEILAGLPEDAKEHTLKYKVAVASLELLVHLTWHIHKDDMHKTANHHQHIPSLQLVQVEYKRAILHHDAAQILRTAVRIGLPAMAQEKSIRSPRENGIISLVLHLIRNVAQITRPPHLTPNDNENEVSRSATIETFNRQDVLQLLLTISSNIASDFETQDVIILETLFYLLKGIDVERLFMDKEQLVSSNAVELKGLLRKEKAFEAGQARHAPTRHGRFGTMVWVKRDEERMTTLSGQDALSGAQRGLSKMDKSKVWKRPRYRGKKVEEQAPDEFNSPVLLTTSARKRLRAFVEDFLDSSFNPLFAHIRRAIEREAIRVVKETHRRQYFYLVSWFLKAECARRKKRKSRAHSEAPSFTAAEESFALIASAMNQETFILLNRYMQESEDMKDWQNLNAGMKCFTQILLTVQEMAESTVEDDLDVAENIQNRIFYEQTTHDRVVNILRNYKDQGFGYLDACTELCHVFIRMLERYSKQNVDLQVRTRRRAWKKRKASRQAETGDDNNNEDQGSEVEDVVQAHATVTERRFDFTRFVARFMSQSCIDTFVALIRFYKDLGDEQLKRAHRFFYRAAFKMEMSVVLFRADIVLLFMEMIKGSASLDSAGSTYKEWEELIRQVFRRMVKKIGERPELVVEMLFSKIPATTFYLEYGYDREVPTRTPRAPALLEVKPGMDKSGQIGVAVSVLLNQDKADALKWIRNVLSSATAERKSWEAEATARVGVARGQDAHDTAQPLSDTAEEPSKAPSIIVKPDNDERRVALFKDNKLRLLMTLIGFERLGADDEPNATWIIPSSLSATSLSESAELISKFEFSPPTYEEGISAEDLLRSKAGAARQRAAYDDDSGSSSGEEEGLFPAGPSINSKLRALEDLKSKRRRRRNKHTDDLAEGDLEQLKESRRKIETAKRKMFKSDIFVHDSDDEENEERDRVFFAVEEERRRKAGATIFKALLATKVEVGKGAKRKAPEAGKHGKKKRMKGAKAGNSDDDSDASQASSTRESSVVVDAPRFGSEEDDRESTETPVSSQHQVVSENENMFDKELGGSMACPRSESDSEGQEEGVISLRKPAETRRKAPVSHADNEDDDVQLPRPARRKVRAGFILESDSE